jgi:hypothetical protein
VSRHAPARVSAYIKLLKRAGAPDKVIDDFCELVDIDDQLAEGRDDQWIESIDDLLFDACRSSNFSRVFDKPGQPPASFRPCLLHGHPEEVGDSSYGSSEFDPAAEQSYRRGYSQGFAEARRLAEEGKRSILKARESEIDRWRRAKVIFGPSHPGSVEPYGITLSLRTTIPAKIRWQVLDRDGRRCVACGASAADGITLHIDHIVSLFNGGSNEPSNLQTLCAPCNLGKGRD